MNCPSLILGFDLMILKSQIGLPVKTENVCLKYVMINSKSILFKKAVEFSYTNYY